MNIKLINEIDLAFPTQGQPKLIQKELALGHKHPENLNLYRSLEGLGWRDVSAEIITATYSSLYLLTDSIFAFYLPAIMTHIVKTNDVSQVEDLCLRFFPRRIEFDRNSFLHRFDLHGKKEMVLDNFFYHVFGLSNLEWKERALIEDFRESGKQDGTGADPVSDTD